MARMEYTKGSAMISENVLIKVLAKFMAHMVASFRPSMSSIFETMSSIFETRAWTQRPRGAFGQRLVALSLGVILFFVMCLVVLPAGARGATGELPIPTEAGSVDSAIPSGGQILGSDTGNYQATAAQDSGGGQQASTNQGVASSATTTQQQPRNIVISVRIDSPGDDGAITQSNIAGAVAEGSNDSSTVQSGGAGGDAQPGGQQAATGQNAGSTATVTQDQAGNLVIAVRINSPGNNGPISQANTA